MRALVLQILQKVLPPGVTAQVSVPENPAHGDYSTNVALKMPEPRKAAEELKKAILQYQNQSGAGIIDRVEVVGPGFVNLFVSEATISNQITEVLKNKEAYGFTQKEQKPEASAGQIGLSKAKKTGQKSVKSANSQPGENAYTQTHQNSQKNLRKSAAQSDLDRQNSSKQEFALVEFISATGKKRIMVEFAHPNTHKAFHIGHLRNITTGESIVRLLESQGHSVIRANYQGDVGMHIAKALYALLEVEPYKSSVQSVTGIKNRVEFLGKAYAAGSKAYEEDAAAKERIKDYNYFIYAAAQRLAIERGLPKPSTDYLSYVRGDKGQVDAVYALWKETRQWSLDYFESIYKRVYTHYDRLYFESECLTGVDRAKQARDQGVLEDSEGAIIFNGKPHNMDTRVFVNNLGLPTYEGKELALAAMETTEFGSLDRLIHVVGPEQASFFKITFKVEELLGMIPPGVQHHLVYGWVRLKHGKMSSRLGNVVLGEWLLDESKKSISKILEKSRSTQYSKTEKEKIIEAAAIAAVKYSFLRVGVSSDIAFDIEASVSFDGDSGPYLQYTYARAKSVLRKSQNSELKSQLSPGQRALNSDERLLARLLIQFPDIVSDAAQNFSPNTVCTYLFHLAQQFNLFYAKHPILGNDTRLALTEASAQVLKNGLFLLGIEVLEQM